MVTYLSSPLYTSELAGVEGAVVITNERLAAEIPDGNTRLLTTGHVQDIFYTIFTDYVRNGCFERLKRHTSRSAHVERSAHLAENVYVDDGAYIGHGTVIMPNTYVGKDVRIKPNSTLGGDGYEQKVVGGKKRLVIHAGGVWLGEGVEIGSSTCIDRGLFGDFTHLGAFTKVDNLVHIAHSVVTGSHCSIVACAEVSGSAKLGEGVWLGPKVAVNQMLSIGAHCYVGTGAVVTRDLPSHALAYGSPAKVKGWCCVCRGKLSFQDGEATCTNCERVYMESAEGPVEKDKSP